MSINKVFLIGYSCGDPTVRYSGDIGVANINLAVRRRSAKKDDPDKQTTDFIRCVAFGKTAEIVESYVKKGSRISVVGRIQTGSYNNKEGQKVYTTDVVIEELEFLDSKKSDEEQVHSTPKRKANSDFINVPDDDGDGELPFN